MKHLLCSSLIVFFTSLMVSANCSANNFSGAWILNQNSSKNQQNKSEMMISISSAGDECKIVTSVQGKTVKEEIFNSGTYRKKLSRDNFITAKLKFISADKFSISKSTGSAISNGRITETIEYWTISDNGNKLTVEWQTNNYYRALPTTGLTNPRSASPNSDGTDQSTYFHSGKTVYIRK